MYERASRLSEVQHGSQLYLLWRPEVRLPPDPFRDRNRGVDEADRGAGDHGQRCHSFEEVVQEGQQQGGQTKITNKNILTSTC